MILVLAEQTPNWIISFGLVSRCLHSGDCRGPQLYAQAIFRWTRIFTEPLHDRGSFRARVSLCLYIVLLTKDSFSKPASLGLSECWSFPFAVTVILWGSTNAFGL